MKHGHSPVRVCGVGFKLRTGYSPHLFAKEAPAVFKYDAETNRVSMVDGVARPWLRQTKSKDARDAPWLYCVDCRERYFLNGRKPKGHIPYRDKASQPLMKKMHERERVAQDADVASQATNGTEEEPEREPVADEAHPQGSGFPVEEELDASMDDAEGGSEVGEEREVMDVDPEVEVPDIVYPTLDEYKQKWARALAKHSMAVPGEFSAANLVPAPISQLWQDCPHVPFDMLKSNDAVARLSRCRPVNGFTPAHVQDGYVRYAHNTGEVNSFNAEL